MKKVYIIIVLQKPKINYITNKNDTGNIFNFKNNLNYSLLKDKILCIENADPGYDFVFNFEIKGLVD